MSLKNLANAEMVAVTKLWVDPASHSHQVLSTRRLTAAILPEVERGHALVAQLGTWNRTRLREIQGEQGSTDVLHDSHVRGMYYRLLSEEELATNPDVAAWYRALRSVLFPDGLSLVKRSYRYEAGHAVILESRLTPEVRNVFARLPTHNGSLLEVTQRYLQLAYRLGALDEERATLHENRRQPQRAEISQARSVWIAAVSMMRMAATMIGPEDEELAAVIAFLDKAEEQAQRRRARVRGQMQEGQDHEAGEDSGAASELRGSDGDAGATVVKSDVAP